jgi:hypothetical protein
MDTSLIGRDGRTCLSVRRHDNPECSQEPYVFLRQIFSIRHWFATLGSVLDHSYPWKTQVKPSLQLQGVFLTSATFGRLKWDPVYNFKESSWPQLPLEDSSETRSATSRSLLDLNYPREIHVRFGHHWLIVMVGAIQLDTFERLC